MEEITTHKRVAMDNYVLETASNHESQISNDNRSHNHNSKSRNSSVPLFYCECSICNKQAKNKVRKPIPVAHRKSLRAQKLGLPKSFT